MMIVLDYNNPWNKYPWAHSDMNPLILETEAGQLFLVYNTN